MNHSNIFSPRVRRRKAYATAFRVFWSYFFLDLKSKIFGKAYHQKRIKKLHLRNAERVKNRLKELQGLFIKFGQLVSNLSNILPEEFREPLEELQDKIPARAYQEIRATIQNELGDTPENIFEQFKEEPLAAASIGQVHRAVLDGEEVVVKIQHHNIDAIAKADLAILKNLVRIHAYFMDMRGLDHTYDQVRLMIEDELDYRCEAKSMQRVADNLLDVPELQIRIPEVKAAYSTSKVLVSTYCEGVNMGNLQEIEAWGLDTQDLSKRLIELYCKMVLVDGFYHADPHPGNILVNQFGEIILLDFGAVAHLSPAFKQAFTELIEAVIRNDTEATVAALRKMGFLGDDQESVKFVEQLISDFKEFLQEEVELDGLNFQNIKLNSGLSSLAGLLKKVNLREVSNKIQIPKEHILLNRTIVLLVGNAYHLAPNLNVLEVVRPYIKKHVLGKERDYTKLLVNTFKNQITTAVSLPHEIAYFLKSAKESQLESELKAVKQNVQQLHRVMQQLLYSVLLFGLIYFLQQYDLEAYKLWRNLHFLAIGLVGVMLLGNILKRRE